MRRFNVGEFVRLKSESKIKNKDIVEKFLSTGKEISINTIKSWTRGENPTDPSRENISILADIFNVPISKLDNDIYKAIKKEIIDAKIVEEIVSEIPIIGTASCGGLDMNYLQIENTKALYRGKNYHKELYCVIANGDSMASEIEDGDEVICDPTVSLMSGDMVHYKIGDESAIKILWEDIDANIIQFIPFNLSDTFKVTTIRKDDILFEELVMAKVISVNKLKMNNRASRLKLIGRG